MLNVTSHTLFVVIVEQSHTFEQGTLTKSIDKKIYGVLLELFYEATHFMEEKL